MDKLAFREHYFISFNHFVVAKVPHLFFLRPLQFSSQAEEEGCELMEALRDSLLFDEGVEIVQGNESF